MIYFAPFHLDLRQGRLWRGDAPVDIRAKTFGVLVYLARRPGDLVTKRELLDAVWNDAAVTEDMPRISIRELRRALGDDARSPVYIETVHGRGYRFIGASHAASTETVPAIRKITGDSPALIGRKAEFESLRSLLADAVAGGERQVVLITGEAGIGKTTLLDAVLDELPEGPDSPILMGRSQCSEPQSLRHHLPVQGEGEPYQPLLEVIAGWSRGSFCEIVSEALRTFAPTWFRELPWLVRDSSEGTDERPVASSDSMVREFCAFVEDLSRSMTVILVLEDLHWADSATLNLLRAVAQRSELEHLVLLATVRVSDGMIFEQSVFSLREELLRKQLCLELPLAPFDETLVEYFLAQRFENDTVASLLAPIAYARTEGNPFLLRALSQYLVDEGLVAQIGGGLELGVDPAELAQRSLEHWMEVPQSIRHMVELELGRLSSTECALIEAVSLAGVEFAAQLAADALDLDLEEFEETCDLLARRGQFIRRNGEVEWPDGSIGARYCFSHALYRDVLQQRLSTTRRRRLHQRLRARLEAGFPGHTDDIAGQLATHCEGFGALEQAVHWLERAARVAMRRYENREVESLLSRALDLLRQLPEHEERTDRELRLLLALGPAVASRNGVGCAQVRQIYSQALELCDRVGSDALLDSALPALGSGNGERSAGGLGPDDRSGEAGEAALLPGQNGMGGGLRRVVSALRARRQTNTFSK